MNQPEILFLLEEIPQVKTWMSSLKKIILSTSLYLINREYLYFWYYIPQSFLQTGTKMKMDVKKDLWSTSSQNQKTPRRWSPFVHINVLRLGLKFLLYDRKNRKEVHRAGLREHNSSALCRLTIEWMCLSECNISKSYLNSLKESLQTWPGLGSTRIKQSTNNRHLLSGHWFNLPYDNDFMALIKINE